MTEPFFTFIVVVVQPLLVLSVDMLVYWLVLVEALWTDVKVKVEGTVDMMVVGNTVNSTDHHLEVEAEVVDRQHTADDLNRHYLTH